MSFSTAKASISGNSVVPGLPNMMSTPSCLSRSRNARLPDMTGTGNSSCWEAQCGAAARWYHDFGARLPCEVHGVPGVTERWEWVQTHGAPTAVRMNVQVERPLRTNLLAVGMDAGGAEHHRAHRHQPVRRGDDLQRRKVIAIVLDRRPDVAPLLAFELRLRGHHFDLGAERHDVLGEHLPHRHKVHFGHKFVPARVPFSDRTLVFFRHGQPLHCHPQLRLSTKLNAPPPAMLRLRHAEDRPPGCIHRDQGRGRAAALRSGAAGGVSLARGEGLCRAADGAAVQGRAVEPDLHAGDAGAQIRAAAEAAGQAAAVGARGGSRVPRDPGACGARAFRSPSR